jgi:hypothetical protein
MWYGTADDAYLVVMLKLNGIVLAGRKHYAVIAAKSAGARFFPKLCAKKDRHLTPPGLGVKSRRFDITLQRYFAGTCSLQTGFVLNP